MPNLNTSIIAELPIRLPPVPEQRKISEILSTWDEAIETVEKLLSNAEAQKRGLMQQLLTGKRRLKGFEGAWQSLLLEEAEARGWLELGRGQVISKKDVLNNPGQFPIYSSSVQSEGLFDHYGSYMFDEEMITWSVDGGGNFFHRPRHKFSVTNVCGWMRVNEKHFRYVYLAAQLQHLHSRLSFDYQLKAHPSVIRKLYRLSVPSLSEQDRIGEVIATSVATIKALSDALRELQREKRALMQQLLTGKRRVKV